jgi:hypothetical protein
VSTPRTTTFFVSCLAWAVLLTAINMLESTQWFPQNLQITKVWTLSSVL